jgi:hypothetical protein
MNLNGLMTAAGLAVWAGADARSLASKAGTTITNPTAVASGRFLVETGAMMPAVAVAGAIEWMI